MSSVVHIVEDDDAVRDSLRLLLRSHGMTVREFDSAAAFLDDKAHTACDCFLFDYNMPGMTGLELVERLREGGVSTPAILISAYPQSVPPDRAARAKIFALLPKSVTDRELTGAIGRALA
jgi:FixJ family two-component response regulator